MQTEARRPMPEWVVPLLVAGVGAPTFGAFLDRRTAAARRGVGSDQRCVRDRDRRRRASDTIRMLRGAEEDERTMLLEYKATTGMGLVLIVALVGLFLEAGIRGENGLVYGVLLLVAEVTHLTALFVLNRKS